MPETTDQLAPERAALEGAMLRLKSALHFLFAAAIFLVASTGAARDVTQAERDALLVAAAKFEAAYRSGDYATVANMMPQRIFHYIADQTGVSVKEVKAKLIREMTEAMDAVVLNSFKLEVSEIEHRKTPTGRPFALIPTHRVVSIKGGGRFAIHNYTIAIIHISRWRLMLLNTPDSEKIVQNLHFGFEGVEFPRGSSQALD